MKEKAQNILSFYVGAEKLKTELRHSWLSNGRQESVAEHTWMLTLLAMVFFSEVKESVDQLKVLKMLVIHDLAEAVVGDIPIFDTSGKRDNKYELEKGGMQKLLSDLPSETTQEFMELWEEYELNQSREAKLAKAIDKLEANIQHNLADFSTWDDGDYKVQIGYKDQHFKVDDLIWQIKCLVDEQAVELAEKTGNLHRFTDEQIALTKNRTGNMTNNKKLA